MQDTLLLLHLYLRQQCSNKRTHNKDNRSPQQLAPKRRPPPVRRIVVSCRGGGGGGGAPPGAELSQLSERERAPSPSMCHSNPCGVLRKMSQIMLRKMSQIMCDVSHHTSTKNASKTCATCCCSECSCRHARQRTKMKKARQKEVNCVKQINNSTNPYWLGVGYKQRRHESVQDVAA